MMEHILPLAHGCQQPACTSANGRSCHPYNLPHESVSPAFPASPTTTYTLTDQDTPLGSVMFFPHPTSRQSHSFDLIPILLLMSRNKAYATACCRKVELPFFFFSRHEFPPCLENCFARALTKTSCVWILTLAKASAKSTLYGTQSHKRKVQSRRVHFSFQESNRNSNYFSESRSGLQIWYPLQSIHRIQGLLRLYFLNWC